MTSTLAPSASNSLHHEQFIVQTHCSPASRPLHLLFESNLAIMTPLDVSGDLLPLPDAITWVQDHLDFILIVFSSFVETFSFFFNLALWNIRQSCLSN